MHFFFIIVFKVKREMGQGVRENLKLLSTGLLLKCLQWSELGHRGRPGAKNLIQASHRLTEAITCCVSGSALVGSWSQEMELGTEPDSDVRCRCLKEAKCPLMSSNVTEEPKGLILSKFRLYL